MATGTEDFSGYEVMRAAMEIERQGQQFYRALSGQMESPQARELFAQLAEDEVRHLKTLLDLLEAYRDDAFWENEEEYLPYLRRFHAETVFPSLQQLGTGDAGEIERRALELAIAAENRFAEYFRMAADYSRNPRGKEGFGWLAAEEERHAALLARRRDLLATFR